MTTASTTSGTAPFRVPVPEPITIPVPEPRTRIRRTDGQMTVERIRSMSLDNLEQFARELARTAPRNAAELAKMIQGELARPQPK